MRAIGVMFTVFIGCIYFINVKWGWDMQNWVGKSVQTGEVEPMPENPLLSLIENMKTERTAFQPTGAGKGTGSGTAEQRLTVSVERTIRFREVLADGEQPPASELQPVYVEARAPQVLADVCQDVIRTLAAKCRVLETASYGPKDGYFTIKGDLTYLPASPVEQAARPRDLLYNAIRVRTKLAPSNETQKIRDTPTVRQKYLNQADRLCTEVRKTFGNCTLSDVTLQSRMATERNRKKGFAGRPSMEVYMSIIVQNQLPEDRYKVEALLEKMLKRTN